MALRLRQRLARKAEGESEDDWGRRRGWRLADTPAGSGNAEGGGVGGSWDSCGSAAAQGACSCCCCRSRHRRCRCCRQVLSGLLRHRGRCSRRPARPAARSKGAERAGGGARGRAGMGRGLSRRPRRGAGLPGQRREERGWGSGGTGRLPSTPAPRAPAPHPGPAPAGASPANQKPTYLQNTARPAPAPPRSRGQNGLYAATTWREGKGAKMEGEGRGA